MSKNNTYLKQQGVALITVLLIFFIASVLATTILWQQHISIARSSLAFSTEQAQQYALGSENLARQILYRDFQVDKQAGKMVDDLSEIWASENNIFPIDNGTLNYHIEDLQGRFNVNNLIKGDIWVTRFKNLLNILGLNPRYADLAKDWIDEDQETSPEGAEEGEYMRLKPAYRTANHPLQDVSELRLLLGMTQQDYQKLAPFIAALPAGTTINVNTVSAPVLQSLLPPGSAKVVVDLALTARRAKRFESLSDEGIPALQGGNEALSVNSQYFEVAGQVVYGDATATLHSVLYRDKDGKIQIKQRDFSPDYEELKTNTETDTAP